MYTFYSSNGYYYPRNNWKDAAVDKWLDQARATVNTAERNKLYSQVANRAYEQAPYLLVPAGVATLRHPRQPDGRKCQHLQPDAGIEHPLYRHRLEGPQQEVRPPVLGLLWQGERTVCSRRFPFWCCRSPRAEAAVFTASVVPRATALHSKPFGVS